MPGARANRDQPRPSRASPSQPEHFGHPELRAAGQHGAVKDRCGTGRGWIGASAGAVLVGAEWPTKSSGQVKRS